MKRLFLFALAATAALSLSACSDDGDGGENNGVPPGFWMQCHAETVPSTSEYTVSDGKLRITANGQSSEMSGKSWGGDKPARGTWTIPPVTSNDGAVPGTVSGTVDIEDGRLTVNATCTTQWKTLKVSASSPATITGTTIEILEAHREEKRWTQATGETTDRRALDPSVELEPAAVTNSGPMFSVGID